MEKKIIIGRYGQEGVDSQLLITIGANESTWGQLGSVPQSVSRQHCNIEVMGNGYLICNLNPMNVTYVNGQPIASQMISSNDVVELGQARYRLDWNMILGYFNPQPSTFTPQPLSSNPQSYNTPAPPFHKSQSNNTLLAMIVGAVVLVGFVVGIIFYIGNNSSRRSYDNPSTSSYSRDDTYADEVEADEPSEPVEQEPQMVSCPMCNGTGIFDFAPGDIMAPKEKCSGCNGTGVCDENTAAKIMEMKRRADAVMGGGGSGGYSSGGSVGGATVTCGMCNGSGFYHWSGAPRYSGNSDLQWTNCMNCGEVIDACSSHSCRCRKCNGTGQI